MADNTNENLGSSIPIQAENPSKKITPAKDTQAITPTQETETMEVHKHPHHVMHKKEWHEYLLEFFMLFLAVFLGFLADNVREHIVEKERAKQLSFSLVSDIRKDSVQLDELRVFRGRRLQQIDSFQHMLQQDPSIIDRRSFYSFARAIQATLFFTPATGTTNELKSAGYLNYFINTKLATFLAEKETISSDCSEDEKIEYNLIYENYYSILRKATDAPAFDSLFNYPQLIHGTGIVAMQKEDLANLEKIVSQLKYQNSVFIHPAGQYDKLEKKGKEITDYMTEKYAD